VTCDEDLDDPAAKLADIPETDPMSLHDPHRAYPDVPLFDSVEAQAARDAAIAETVEPPAGECWAKLALDAVAFVCATSAEFTTDDVLKAAPELEACPERRVLGAAMCAARRGGICAPTDRYAMSDRVVSHARPKRVWRSLAAQAPKGDR
jgi:hypothetical protein